jgi:hypothetical protein
MIHEFGKIEAEDRTMNAKTKHTAGEWKAYYPADAQPGDACEDAAVIASEYGMIAVTVDDVGDESEQNANARLIAAAPDLLSVCKRMVAVFSFDRDCLGSKCGVCPLCKARAAIAKAEWGA